MPGRNGRSREVPCDLKARAIGTLEAMLTLAALDLIDRKDGDMMGSVAAIA